MQYSNKPIPLFDFAPQQNTFRQDVLQGLHKSCKELASKYFYDETGSQLFDQICELDEYYVTRTEQLIMREQMPHIAALLGEQCMLIEYGSGSSIKTRQLLDHLVRPAVYVPIDIAKTHLRNTAAALARDYPTLEILPICADYTSDFALPQPKHAVARKVAYYPGSTIGNFDPPQAISFLMRIARACGVGGGLLIGVDLKKDGNVLHRAYNDGQGVTARFNLHLLERINQEFTPGFPVDQFRHYAFYNPRHGRVEMHLMSVQPQRVQLDDQTIMFAQGETIWTESSYKYTLDEFAHVAGEAGFAVEHTWLDPQRLFSVQYLVVR
ncbi:MAG TPA: L-histidine N(alpha)-methyltransferase [Ktedonobacteraceae bacterium]|nr:L-histidine N(alpha)-methyltransferase [Ktedonobacteraceae bacterium]